MSTAILVFTGKDEPPAGRTKLIPDITNIDQLNKEDVEAADSIDIVEDSEVMYFLEQQKIAREANKHARRLQRTAEETGSYKIEPILGLSPLR